MRKQVEELCCERRGEWKRRQHRVMKELHPWAFRTTNSYKVDAPQAHENKLKTHQILSLPRNREDDGRGSEEPPYKQEIRRDVSGRNHQFGDLVRGTVWDKVLRRWSPRGSTGLFTIQKAKGMTEADEHESLTGKARRWDSSSSSPQRFIRFWLFFFQFSVSIALRLSKGTCGLVLGAVCDHVTPKAMSVQLRQLVL